MEVNESSEYWAMSTESANDEVTQNSALSTQYSVLSTQSSVLSTQYRFVCV